MTASTTSAPSGKRKVAVLGGGAGSMAALWALTSLPGAADRYDITVYQMGWRLGGKGASGRNAAFGQRIEEHGLHVWAGFYRNAFRMMREIYAAQPDDGRLFTQWSDAFKRHSQVLLEEHVNGEWIGWAIDLPEDPDDDPAADPTRGGEIPAPGEYLRLIIDAMIRRADEVRWDLESAIESHAVVATGGWLTRVEQVLGESEAAMITPVLHAAGVFTEDGVVSVARHAAKPLLRAAHGLAAALPADPRLHSAAHLTLIAYLVRDGVAAAHAVLALHAADDHEARRVDDLLSLAGATVVGLIDDDVLKQGFEAINDVDWTVWMGRHGARPEALGVGDGAGHLRLRVRLRARAAPTGPRSRPARR